MTKRQDLPRSGHPIELFLCATRDALEGLADVPVWSMDDATTDRVVVLAAQVAAGVAELEARAVGQAETLGRPGAAQCRSVAQWLQVTTRVTGSAASAKARLATALRTHEATRAAMTRGAVHAEQVRAITDVLADLGPEVSDHDRRRAEAFLVDHAADHDAPALAHLGREIQVRLDPESAEAREAEALEAQERLARTRTRLTMYDDTDGLTHGRFAIPVAQGAMLRKALAAIAAPKSVRGTHGAGTYDRHKPTPHQLGLAFTSYVERFPARRLPSLGGLNATVIAIGDHEILRGRVKAAGLDTGTRISHTEYLRLACEAGIVPMWMDADGEVLSSGRLHRFHTRPQRLAAIVEQRHCQHGDCAVPGYLCHLHHRVPWAEGGETSVRDAVLLCPFHHGVAHTGREVASYPMRT